MGLAERWRSRYEGLKLGDRDQRVQGTEKKLQIVLSGCLCGIPRYGANGDRDLALSTHMSFHRTFHILLSVFLVDNGMHVRCVCIQSFSCV